MAKKNQIPRACGHVRSGAGTAGCRHSLWGWRRRRKRPREQRGREKVEHVNGTAVWWTDRPPVYANRRLPSMPTAAGARVPARVT